LLDECLKHATEAERFKTARFICYGEDRYSVPMVLIHAQESLLAALDLPS